MVYTKESITEELISKVENAGYEKILSNKKPYRPTFKIKCENLKEGHYPDVVATFDNKTDLFSIETNENTNINKKVDKWKMFSVYAKANKSCLYIVGVKPIIKKIQDKIDSKAFGVKFLEII
jgi:hypothetical protein